MNQVFDKSKVFSMEQAIGLCQSPKHNFLPMILSVIANKLNLTKSVFALDSSSDDNEEPVYKFYEEPEMFKLGKSGLMVPVQTKTLDSKISQVKEKSYKPVTKSESFRIDGKVRRMDALQDVTEGKIYDIEKSLARVTIQIDKLVLQQESLQKKIKLEIERSSILNLENSQLVEQHLYSDRSLMTKDVSGIQRLYRKDIEAVHKEFKQHFCVLTKKVMKISDSLEECKDIGQKLEHVKKILDKVAAKDYVDSVNEKVDSICTRTCILKKDIGKINNTIEDIITCAQYTEKRIKELQDQITQLKKIREILERLDSFDQWKKKIHDELEKFTEITEHLKIIKADREELDILFDEKADRDDLLKLVSLEFFKSVQDDLTSGVIQVLEQLMRDEIEWEKAYKEIQLMLDVKADSCEVTSLKKYINCKLEIIQKKLNDIIRNKLTSHAAAVRIRLLKDARCITCTAEADLNKLEHPIPLLGSIKHYEVKCLCEPRTRYCGGSHTLVGPDQKLITKHREPLKSAAATTLNFAMTEGIDGRLYRTRVQKCICEPIKPKEEEKVTKKELFPC